MSGVIASGVRQMSQNDLIVLDSNFNNWLKNRAQGLKKVQPWLYYCVEQFVKPFALSDEDIFYGITDGNGDGGVDALYFLINRSQLVQEDTEIDARSVVESPSACDSGQIEQWLCDD